jgi:hypothetical protein
MDSITGRQKSSLERGVPLFIAGSGFDFRRFLLRSGENHGLLESELGLAISSDQFVHLKNSVLLIISADYKEPKILQNIYTRIRVVPSLYC